MDLDSILAAVTKELARKRCRVPQTEFLKSKDAYLIYALSYLGRASQGPRRNLLENQSYTRNVLKAIVALVLALQEYGDSAELVEVL